MSGPMIDLEKGWTMNNQDLATLLAELDAKVRQMTPGPWQALEQIDEKWRVDGNDDDPLARFAQGYDEQKANAHGIVALVNAYPALRAALQAEYDANFSMSAELTALHLENDRLRAQIEQLQQQLETSRMSEVEQAKRRGELGLEVVKLRRECDEARARAIRWNNEHAAAEDRWVEERDALRAEVLQLRKNLLRTWAAAEVHEYDLRKLVAQQREALVAIVNECTKGVGEITWPPGVALIAKARAVLAQEVPGA